MAAIESLTALVQTLTAKVNAMSGTESTELANIKAALDTLAANETAMAGLLTSINNKLATVTTSGTLSPADQAVLDGIQTEVQTALAQSQANASTATSMAAPAPAPAPAAP
jgi:hypothetical protein